MDKIELIKECIAKAERGESKLEGAVLDIGGYTSPTIRHLLNNLGSLATSYMEIGVHRGSTFCSTIYKNENIRQIFAVDNWSEFSEDPSVKAEFLENIRFAANINGLWFSEIDCFDLNPEIINISPDLYLYDGNHADWAQKKALTHFYEAFPKEMIFCVDDSSWDAVRKGTEIGISECEFEVLFEQHLFDGQEGGRYWNGFSIYLLKKTK